MPPVISRHQRGQALVELALLLPVLALLFLGTLDLGRAFYTHVALGNAARVGVLYAQQVYDPAVPAPLGCAAPATGCRRLTVQDVMDKTLAEPQGGLDPHTLSVTVCLPAQCYGAAPGQPPAAPIALTYGEPITVEVSAPFTPVTRLVHGFTLGSHVTGSTVAAGAALTTAVLPAEQTAAAAAAASPSAVPRATVTTGPGATPTATDVPGATSTSTPTALPTETATPQPTATPKCTGQCAKATDTPTVPAGTPTAPGVTDTPTPPAKCTANGNGTKACPTPTP